MAAEYWLLVDNATWGGEYKELRDMGIVMGQKESFGPRDGLTWVVVSVNPAFSIRDLETSDAILEAGIYKKGMTPFSTGAFIESEPSAIHTLSELPEKASAAIDSVKSTASFIAIAAGAIGIGIFLLGRNR